MNDIDTTQLDYKISNFTGSNEIRFIVQDRETYTPPISLSAYETHLRHKSPSESTISTELYHASYFFTWAKRHSFNADEALCCGLPIEGRTVNAFSAWLKKRGYEKNGKTHKLNPKSYNAILTSISSMSSYFVTQQSELNNGTVEEVLQKSILVNAVSGSFKHQKKKDRKKEYSDDLTEEEIKEIEKYLRPEDISKATSTQIRNYIIWRLAIEFGLRLGEILALRIQDVQQPGKEPFINIQRIEERGDDYHDPRETPPRPKTLSRQLGFMLKDSPLPLLLNEYISSHRFKYKNKILGEWKRVIIMDKPGFLILSHRNGKTSGNPLSISTSQNIAKLISDKTGVAFHWHLARHAYFNRAYAAILDKDNFNQLKMDLITWGGWEDDKSLQIYINRVKKYRARKALMDWQSGEFKWEALS